MWSGGLSLSSVDTNETECITLGDNRAYVSFTDGIQPVTGSCSRGIPHIPNIVSEFQPTRSSQCVELTWVI